MEDFVSDEQAILILRARCRQRGGAATLAERAGVSRCSISLMLSGQRRIGHRLAPYLGLKPVQGFIRNERTKS